MRVAVASTDGKVINQHFGHADQFLIFDLSGSDPEFIELRKCSPICGSPNQPGHSEDAMEERMRLITDCGAVLCSRIGYGMQEELRARKIKPVEAADFIEAVLMGLSEEVQGKA